jgi:hypothetical protein
VDRIEVLRDEIGGLLADHEVVFSHVFGSCTRGDDRPRRLTLLRSRRVRSRAGRSAR